MEGQTQLRDRPEWAVQDAGGGEMGEKPTTVVDWATWCGSMSCREFLACSRDVDMETIVDEYLDAEPALGWLAAEREEGGDSEDLRARVRAMMIAEIDRVR